MGTRTKGLAHLIMADAKAVAEKIGKFPNRREYEANGKHSQREIESVFGSWGKLILAAGAAKVLDHVDEGEGPKVLFIDIETFPALYHAYQPRTEFLRKDQMVLDVAMRSWAAKWLGDDNLLYRDTRGQKDPRNAAKILPELWKLMDEADVIIGQNSNKFDIPKIQGWFMLYKTKDRHPPSPFKKVDTKNICKKHFGLTYNSLEHMCEFFGVKHRKLKHERFPGLELPRQCEAGNLAAWKENEEYNKNDVLCLEDVWTAIRAWDNSLNQNLFTASKVSTCHVPGCGGQYVKNGHYYPTTGKYQRYACMECGHPARGRDNLLSRGKKNNLKVGVSR